jgi:hypothetical protein
VRPTTVSLLFIVETSGINISARILSAETTLSDPLPSTWRQRFRFTRWRSKGADSQLEALFSLAEEYCQDGDDSIQPATAGNGTVTRPRMLRNSVHT